MSDKVDHIWAILEQSGVVQGTKPGKRNLDSPWYIKVLLAFSGWFAAIFIIGFIGVGFKSIFKDSISLIILGLVMTACAFLLLNIRKTEFVEHLGLAVSLAGQILVTVAIFKILKHNETVAWLTLAFLQVLLVIVMPNFVHRVFSSFVTAFAFSMAFNEMDIPYVLSGIVMFMVSFCWLNEFKYPKYMNQIRAAGYGLTLALILLESVTLFGTRIFGYYVSKDRSGLWAYPWIGEIIIGLVAVYVVWSLIKKYDLAFYDKTTITCLTAAVLLCAVSMKVQGVTVGIVIMVLGFSLSNRILTGIGIISLLFYISSYYYQLDKILLVKSGILLAVGVVLLIIRWIMLYVIPLKKEVHHG